MKNVKKTVLLFSVLLLPSLIYLLLSTGTHRFKQLNVFGPVTVNEKGDSIEHTISDFKFTGQDGRTVTQQNFEGKIYVADFFFATCPSICPKMTSQLYRVQKMFEAERDVKILSHTVDPDRDSVKALAEYGKRYMINPKKWFLVTGDKKAIYDLARNGYFVTAKKGDGGPNDFIHSEKLVLIDKEKRIRGYYDGTSPTSVDTLLAEIKVLLAEYKK